MTNTNNMMINPTVASHIAYLINRIDCACLSMHNDANTWGSEEYNNARAIWCVAIHSLSEYGIELPNLKYADGYWKELTPKQRRHGELVVRTLEQHIELEA